MRGRVLAVVWALILVVAVPQSAAANEEETDDGRLLVVQAVSLIANEATLDSIQERIEDVLSAPETAGVDMDKVQEALELVESSAGDPELLVRARVALEESVDVRAASGYGEIPAPGEVGTDMSPYATGAATGTSVVLDPLDPALGISDAGDAVLLVLAALSTVLGLFLIRRWRPTHSLRELRTSTSHGAVTR